jgi:hypothetical protein
VAPTQSADLRTCQGRDECRSANHVPGAAHQSKVTFFDGNFSEYEDWRKKTLGEAATRPHRITYRKLTR